MVIPIIARRKDFLQHALESRLTQGDRIVEKKNDRRQAQPELKQVKTRVETE